MSRFLAAIHPKLKAAGVVGFLAALGQQALLRAQTNVHLTGLEQQAISLALALIAGWVTPGEAKAVGTSISTLAAKLAAAAQVPAPAPVTVNVHPAPAPTPLPAAVEVTTPQLDVGQVAPVDVPPAIVVPPAPIASPTVPPLPPAPPAA